MMSRRCASLRARLGALMLCGFAFAPQPGQAAQTHRFASKCQEFKFGGQNITAACEPGLELSVPTAQERAQGVPSTVTLHSRAAQAASLVLEVTGANMAGPDGVKLGLGKLNGIAVGGSCTFMRNGMNRAAAMVMCITSGTGTMAGGMSATHSVLTGERDVDALMQAAYDIYNSFNPRAPLTVRPPSPTGTSGADGYAGRAVEALRIDARCVRFDIEGTDLSSGCEPGIDLHLPNAAAVAMGERPQLSFSNRQVRGNKLTFELVSVLAEKDALGFQVRAPGARDMHQGDRCWTVANSPSSGKVQLRCKGTGSRGPINGPYVSYQLGSEAGDTAAALQMLERVRASLVGGTEVAQAQVNAASAAATQATAHAMAQLSSDRRAIFGLLVGARAPVRAPTCRESFNDEPVMPKYAPFCFSKVGTGLAVLQGELTGISADEYKSVGLRPVSLQVNDSIFDTRIASDVLITIDQDDVIQQILIRTWASQHESVLAMLNEKFGHAQRQDETTWSNDATGQVVGRTPNFYWERGNILVAYTSHTAAALGGSATELGEVIVYSARYRQLLDQIAARRNAPLPNRRRM